MIGDRYYITLGASKDGIVWDLRKGAPDEGSVRIDNGTAFTWVAAAHQATNALQRYTEARQY